MRRRVAWMSCAVLVLCGVRSARADSFAVPSIIGGHYTITDSGDSYRFELFNSYSNADVILSGSAARVAGISALSCYICDPGAVFQVGRHTLNPFPGASGAADMGTGTFSFGSQTDDYRFAGWLAFLADPIVLPASGSSSISFTIPFRARVSIDGQLINNPGAGFFARWEGAGTAHVSFNPTANGRWENSSGQLLRFEFSNATPVPEPASMFLMGTGIAGLIVARKKRRA